MTVLRAIAGRPALLPVLIAVCALLVYHAWITTLPLAAGDWQWMPIGQLRSWFPSATVWWPQIGFGLKNFGGIYELPIEAIGGLLSLVGVESPWSVRLPFKLK